MCRNVHKTCAISTDLVHVQDLLKTELSCAHSAREPFLGGEVLFPSDLPTSQSSSLQGSLGGILNPTTLHHYNINTNFAWNLNHDSTVLGVLNPQSCCPLEKYVVCFQHEKQPVSLGALLLSFFCPSSIL